MNWYDVKEGNIIFFNYINKEENANEIVGCYIECVNDEITFQEFYNYGGGDITNNTWSVFICDLELTDGNETFTLLKIIDTNPKIDFAEYYI